MNLYTCRTLKMGACVFQDYTKVSFDIENTTLQAQEVKKCLPELIFACSRVAHIFFGAILTDKHFGAAFFI